MTYLALAYPVLSDTDLNLIQEFRRRHDKLHYERVFPHFTLVFPADGIATDIFLLEIKRQLKEVPEFHFTVGRATIHEDDFNNYFHAFLVPSEGYKEIVNVHDKLYSKRLSDYHRKDIDYIPHIAVGNSINKSVSEEMIEEWNANEYRISGTIHTVDVAGYDGGKIYPIERIRLGYKNLK
jgi:hypothetical protein